MKLAMVLGVGWCALGCSLMKTESSSTTPSHGGGSQPVIAAPPQSSGPDALFMPTLEHYKRGDAESMLRAKGFTGQILATGDTDPAQDGTVCEAPPFGKYAPNVTITLAYCATYVAPNEGPQIVGLPLDAAKQKVVAAGFTGEVEVMELSEYDASCKAGNVCQVSPTRWYLNQEHRMQLLVNSSTVRPASP